MAISGHKTLKEVERYVKEAEQERLARAAMARISEHESGTASGNPDRPKLATPLKSLKNLSKK
jgi:hypothetical protein